MKFWIHFFEKRSDFSKNCLDIRFDTVEKHDIINSYIKKGYAAVVFSDSKVTVLEEGKNTTFCSLLY